MSTKNPKTFSPQRLKELAEARFKRAERQADGAQAMKEYRLAEQASRVRNATLRAERLARDVRKDKSP